MVGEVITSVDQVTPEWLTGVLRRSGALVEGAVEAVDAGIRESENALNARLHVGYAKGSRGEMPRRLFLKLVNADMEDDFFGSSEVNYYVRDYVGLEGAPLVRCYDAVFSKERLCYHLLLDDLSATHVDARARAPTLEHGFALAEGLAVMHAHWWGAERLKEGGEPIPSAEVIERFVDVARPGVGHILDYCTDQLAAHWPEAMHEIFEHHPRLMVDRLQDGNGFALIHGDANPGNILVPIEGDRPLYIVDRQPFDHSLTTWLGVYDLSYAIVHRWQTETRRRFQNQILRRYHAHLLRSGVRDYAWEQLYRDYRLSAVMSVYVATDWCWGGVNEATVRFWLPMLQKALTAFDDLECRKLWADGQPSF